SDGNSSAFERRGCDNCAGDARAGHRGSRHAERRVPGRPRHPGPHRRRAPLGREGARILDDNGGAVSVASPPAPSAAPAPVASPVVSPTARAAFAALAQQPTRRSGGLRFTQAIPSALEALKANKGRAVLTTLGIVIGVAAVIAIVALGQGSSA